MSSLIVFFLPGAMLTAYLIGSIPVGVLVTRAFTGQDIRKLGSGNVGATNVRRMAGNGLGAVVLAGDVLKGLIPVGLVMAVGPRFVGHGRMWAVWVSLAALGAFLGHLYPVYFKGRSGGKGVATAVGCFLPISPMAVAGALLVFLLVVWRLRVVSLGSLSAAVALPVLVWFRTGTSVFPVLAVVTAGFIFLRHSANLRRLREGTEPKI